MIFSSLEFLLIIVIIVCISYAPYTKVEESFNLQACHDILNYGITSEGLEKYDHIQFPGVVPRTFLGSLVVSGIAKILSYTGLFPVEDGEFATQGGYQFLIRCVIGLLNGITLNNLKINLVAENENKARSIGIWFALLQCSQFHMMFYVSRTLPNFMALPITNHVLSQVVLNNYDSLFWLGFAGVVFRLEIGVFGGILAIVSSLIFRRSSFTQNIIVMVKGVFVGVIVSLVIDSYFWNSVPTLPELSSFVFNVVEGKSVEWGVEPYHTYFTKYLGSLLTSGVYLLFIIPGFVFGYHKHQLRVLTLSSLIYIAIMSFQPHKEWRFIIYTVPAFTCAIANGIDSLTYSYQKLSVRRLVTFISIIMLAFSFVTFSLKVYISSFNYPGGVALEELNVIIANRFNNVSLADHPLNIHIDVPACMTGVSLFGEIQSPFVNYDKTEDYNILSQKWNTFNYLITAVDGADQTAEENGSLFNAADWNKLHSVKGFDRIDIRSLIKLIKNPQSIIKIIQQGLAQSTLAPVWEVVDEFVVLEDKIFIYERTVA